MGVTISDGLMQILLQLLLQAHLTCLIPTPFRCGRRPVESDQTSHVPTYLVILTFERLLPTLPAFGGLFLLAQHAGFLVEAPATNLRQHACFLYFFLKALQRTLEGLVLIHDNTRHTRPSPLASRRPTMTQRATRCSLQDFIIGARRKMSNQDPLWRTGSTVRRLSDSAKTQSVQSLAWQPARHRRGPCVADLASQSRATT